MANDLNSLLDRVERMDRSLATELRQQISTLAKRREFGLNFEKHKPETVELYGRSVRVGDKVHILAPRGARRPLEDARTWRVQAIRQSGKKCEAQLVLTDGSEERLTELSELVVVADFRDPIYPGLRSTGAVCRGGDKPHHLVVNAENFHALEALLFACHGKVDLLYLDPPFNSGARDWKYNNDYVDSEDSFRHSKWLSFMERRLKLARRLLNPLDSVLIVAIDEKEYLRLGLLLEQTFPGANIQMISTVISPSGAARNREFTRVNEYLFFVMIGSAAPVKTPDDMLFTEHRSVSQNRSPIWNQLRRLGAGPARADSPSKFYPVLIDATSHRILGAGDPLPRDRACSTYVTPTGMEAVWPIRTDGSEGRWELNKSSFEQRLASGHIRLNGRGKNGDSNVQYLRNAQIERLASGELLVTGTASEGWLQIDYAIDRPRELYAKTVWNKPSHDARTYGSWILRELIPKRSFPYPKSLYAVEDALRFFAASKPDALVLDFFAGSGTTAHAVMRLNHQYGGRRTSISVTNNEVSAAEQTVLRKQGHRPGDPEWESLGICDHITKPRIEAAVLGLTPEGQPVRGDYKFVDPFPMCEGFEENVEFFTLTYEDPRVVGADLAFEAVAPLLWIRAGQRGPQITARSDTYALACTYGVLFSVDSAGDFATELATREGIGVAFIVTDDEKQFQRVSALLPRGVETVRLYESYLRTFEINTGKE